MLDSTVIDLFCGVGGMTHGFIATGFNVVAGIDIDESCRFAYEANNVGAAFRRCDVAELKGSELDELFGDAKYRVLIGCAPCQPFTAYRRAADRRTVAASNNSAPDNADDKWKLLDAFARLIEEARPDVVSMENVIRLRTFEGGVAFRKFVARLEAGGYSVSWHNVNCLEYGIPQARKRLVLLASLHGRISLAAPTHSKESFRSVRDAIGQMPRLDAGETDPNDLVHRCADLSPINQSRLSQSKQGGTWADWDVRLRLTCHKRESGKSYRNVYGRMSWESPSPTITTQFYGIGKGRFGHPDQARAISLREGALLQTFPIEYSFVPVGMYPNICVLARHIGNAVPVDLGRVIARSIEMHLGSLSS